LQTTFTAEIARLFLLWPGRFERERCVGRLHSGEAEALQRDCAWYVGALLTSFHEDDLSSALDDFFKYRRALGEWYGALLEERGITIEFFDAQPRIGRERFSDWWWLTRFFDPDALITYRLAAQRQAERIDRLHLWGTFPVSADAELDKALSRGLADTHVHLTGCEPVPLLWQRLVADTIRIRIEQIERYSVAEMEKISGDSEALRHRLFERSAIEVAIAKREELRKAMEDDVRWRRTLQPAAEPLVPSLAEERRLLAWAWNSVLQGSTVTEERLDRYLFAKNVFLGRHHLYAVANPGLRTFRRYFDGTKEKVGHRSRRLQILEAERRLHFATESPYLSHLELRISPFDNIAEYVEFFRTWERAAHSLRRHRRPEVRFTVHFIRSSDRDASEEIPFEKLRRKVDRQSAVLHLFRQKVPELARYIVGIDVANLERDCPPSVFTPYILFLRGQIEAIRNSDCHELCHSFWLRLKDRNEADHPVDLPRLGLTYHAGEDFYHPIEGMRNMDDAIQGAKMGPGDRLGHGLAAGWDLELFYGSRGRGLTLPQGVLLDDLVWLWRRLDSEGASYRKEGHQLLEEIADLSRKVYGHSVPPALLYRLQRHWRHQPVTRSPLALSGDTIARDILVDEESLWHMELFDHGCRQSRIKTVPLSDFFIKNPRALMAVQEELLRELARQRIIVEFNPTSNWALGHFPDLRSHPFHRYLEVQGPEALVSFNTDDPGVLGSRIENEFELMLEAMVARGSASGKERSECLDLLENVRRVGVESVFRGAGSTKPRRPSAKFRY